jgi:hypothetical protein
MEEFYNFEYQEVVVPLWDAASGQLRATLPEHRVAADDAELNEGIARGSVAWARAGSRHGSRIGEDRGRSAMEYMNSATVVEPAKSAIVTSKDSLFWVSTG